MGCCDVQWNCSVKSRLSGPFGMYSKSAFFPLLSASESTTSIQVNLYKCTNSRESCRDWAYLFYHATILYSKECNLESKWDIYGSFIILSSRFSHFTRIHSLWCGFYGLRGPQPFSYSAYLSSKCNWLCFLQYLHPSCRYHSIRSVFPSTWQWKKIPSTDRKKVESTPTHTNNSDY